MELAVVLVPEHMAPDIRRYIASQGRVFVGDISLLTGDTQSAMRSYLKEATDSPAHWYQAGQIAFREGDFVSACTYVRRGIAANPYIAEGLTGRTKITERDGNPLHCAARTSSTS